MPVNSEILRWARKKAGYSSDVAATIHKNLLKWESGELRPTYPQLEKLANLFKVPVSIFFFPDPPSLPPVEETFRTLNSEQFSALPPRIHQLLWKAMSLKFSLEDLTGGKSPPRKILTRDLSFQLGEDRASLARKLREYLGVTLEAQMRWPSSANAVDQWRKALQNVGVWVFKDSFRDKRFSGFSLYDEEFPIVYVNNTSTKNRQIFTLFHELAHLLYGTSGVDSANSDPPVHTAAHQKNIETACNSLAAEFLVPDYAFDQELSDSQQISLEIERLANRFKVSREVISRKCFARGLINERQYIASADLAEKQIKPPSGGDYINNRVNYLGREFVELAFRTFYSGSIDKSDLADHLGVKTKSIERIEDRLLGRVTGPMCSTQTSSSSFFTITIESSSLLFGAHSIDWFRSAGSLQCEKSEEKSRETRRKT